MSLCLRGHIFVLSTIIINLCRQCRRQSSGPDKMCCLLVLFGNFTLVVVPYVRQYPFMRIGTYHRIKYHTYPSLQSSAVISKERDVSQKAVYSIVTSKLRQDRAQLLVYRMVVQRGAVFSTKEGR